ncbi:adenylate/guanylate cyclase domain-containing protein [Nocardioides sp. R-C-SC26]|uniref:adenylate/guanylate cyclase domain-containing protein n=1 Tax=Nocardioides sp. R-C-SC26 TaxID=2870414 RepID=UPI001E310E6B|nr:adenylate/guanylate cyclase domain-containing protein [Nocardioides sp. R-C-SC26]
MVPEPTDRPPEPSATADEAPLVPVSVDPLASELLAASASGARAADTAEAVSDLTRAILGEDPVLTAAEVAAVAGLSVDQARRLWRALGFPEGEGARLYTSSDAEALATLVSSVHRGLLDFDLAVAVTRALGQTMARLADWEASALVHRIEELHEAESDGSEESTPERVALRMFSELGMPFEELMIYAWRRHLGAAAARIVGLSDVDPHTIELTVGFADLVSFTALSNELSRERIGDLVELFESRCADVVAGQGGRVIKSIGDSVLFVNDDPIRAYDTAEGIIAVIGRDPRMPDVRVGLASGSVVTRLGDVFGPPVNMASRLTHVARRNRIIVDAALAALLPDDQFESRLLPARPVRGFGIVEPVAVRRI